MVQQDRAARTREALMRAAAGAFAEEGFVPASLTAISKRAGVSNGALHFHFRNKDLLAQAVEEEAAKTVSRITREADERSTLPLQRLIDATYALMSAVKEDIVVRAGLELVGAAPRRNEAADLRGQWRQWIERVLASAHDEGSLAEGVSPSDASDAVVAATVGFEVLGVKDPAWMSRGMVRRYFELMLPRLAHPELLAHLDLHGTHPPTAWVERTEKEKQTS